MNSDEIKQQHINNYKQGVLEIINNNTNILFDEDIKSLIKKPPLDSMDIIKNKIISITKGKKIVVNNTKMDSVLDEFRNSIIVSFSELKKIRIEKLYNIINKVNLDNDEYYKFIKKDFKDINNVIKKKIKELIQESGKQLLKDKDLFDKVDDNLYKEISDEFLKYIKSSYIKNIMENIDIKILVKDMTLINTVKEVSERYMFTLKNSRVFDL